MEEQNVLNWKGRSSWLVECFLDWEFLMAASSNQKHAHFIPFKPTPKTLVIQIYKKDSTEQIHTSDKNMANTLFLLFTVLSLHFHSQSYIQFWNFIFT